MKTDNEDEKYIPLTLTRHSYSLHNTNRFKTIIDKCITNKTDEFISAESQGVSVLTLRHRLSEALLWLCNNDVKDSSLKKEDYIKVRPYIKTTPVSFGGKPGILLSWKVIKYSKSPISTKIKAKDTAMEAGSISVANKLSRLESNSNVNLHWKERVLNFIGNDDAVILDISSPEDFKHNPLSDIDIEWLTTTFSKAGLEFEVDAFSIKAVKG